jgi:hypothetical protein
MSGTPTNTNQIDFEEDPLLTQISKLITQYNAQQLDRIDFPMRLIAENHNYVCRCRNCAIESSEVDEYRAQTANSRGKSNT